MQPTCVLFLPIFNLFVYEQTRTPIYFLAFCSALSLCICTSVYFPAGILWSMRASECETIMQLQTKELISEILPNETGEDAGWIKTGSVMTAKNQVEFQDTTKLTSVSPSCLKLLLL